MNTIVSQTQVNLAGTFIDECQVANMLCQSVRTIQKWRVTGNGPGFYKLGRSVRYESPRLHRRPIASFHATISSTSCCA